MAFPDVELVCLSLLADLGYTCTALPDGDEWSLKFPLIAINRIGGGVDADGITDRALVAIVVVEDTRPKAWSAAGRVRQRMLAAGGTEVGGILIDSVEEAIGNTQVPDITEDNRFVDASFFLSFREQS
ncbi:hypothetical protein NONI108955_20795 [Nocardia ninae]|uniref:DUF3168 domain-containing protein n=1 Tax=Nocardia ninae NBRC 108245 TaxID=1210091 RepID=A0A511M9Q6_9NOCA|nr:hypothetical protein [Nocardia ninae]GEM37394.1 hypothetical protein NN4_19130 [Nocardia ninae NBRC 108245]